MSKNNKLLIKQTAPLHPQDTKEKTYGCRHSNPDICGSSYMPNICAFVTKDKICYKPPTSWIKKIEKVKEESNEN